MKYRIEEIENLAFLSLQDKQLVLKEYRKHQYPSQIEYQVWSYMIPFLAVFAFEIYYRIVKDVEIDLHGFKFSILSMSCMIIYVFLLHVIEVNLLAPKILRKILENLDKIKSNRTMLSS